MLCWLTTTFTAASVLSFVWLWLKKMMKPFFDDASKATIGCLSKQETAVDELNKRTCF